MFNALNVFTVVCNACGIWHDIVLSLAIPQVSVEIL